jgi:hypothetical protein
MRTIKRLILRVRISAARACIWTAGALLGGLRP